VNGMLHICGLRSRLLGGIESKLSDFDGNDEELQHFFEI
jgi:hypothetical protein